MKEPRPETPATHSFSVAGRLRSFGYAISGIGRMIRGQNNAWIHSVATLLVLAAAAWLGLSRGDWCWIILAIALVWIAEAFNTAIECVADAISKEFHPLVRDAKDIAAGAVLIAAIASAVIGLIIFLPYLERHFAS